MGLGSKCDEFSDEKTCNGLGKVDSDGSCMCWTESTGADVCLFVCLFVCLERARTDVHDPPHKPSTQPTRLRRGCSASCPNFISGLSIL